MDARHHSSAAAAAADPIQVDQVIIPQDVDRNDSGLITAVNNEPGAIQRFMVDDAYPHMARRDVSALAKSCLFFHSIFKSQLDKLSFKELQALNQAVIDDDRQRVRDILNAKPSLLWFSISSSYVIESKLTWQKFKLGANDTPLAIAAKRHQIEMVKLLLPYYDKLAQDGQLSSELRQYVSTAREAALKAWSFYAMTKNSEDQDEIVIPTEYSSVINNLVDVFISENLAAGLTDFTALSENTESAMLSLLNLLVPKSAIELDNYIDVELLLLAAYQLYVQRYNHFTSWEQRDAFCIRVISLIQSALSPETAKIFCEGLFNVVERKLPISARAASLKLYGGESFYRGARESLSGLAGKYLCGLAGRARTRQQYARKAAVFLQNLCRTKASNIQSLCSHVSQSQSQSQSQSHRPGV